jgi:predicted nicotinamide N-methyase
MNLCLTESRAHRRRTQAAAPPVSRLRHELLHRIHRHYRTVTGPIDLGPLKLQFTRIAEPDRVLDDVVARETDGASANLHIPYWAELWESALGLGRVIGQIVRPGMRVLDLGCGMGLTSAAAAAAGAKVVMADLEPLALLLARLNTLPWRNQVTARRVNWQTDLLNTKSDLIAGSDIIYEQSQWPTLENFWRIHLAPGGILFLAEPSRQTAEQFPAWMTERGWNVRITENLPRRPPDQQGSAINCLCLQIKIRV